MVWASPPSQIDSQTGQLLSFTPPRYMYQQFANKLMLEW